MIEINVQVVWLLWSTSTQSLHLHCLASC